MVGKVACTELLHWMQSDPVEKVTVSDHAQAWQTFLFLVPSVPFRHDTMLLCPHLARIGGKHVLASIGCQVSFSTLISKWQRRRDRLTALMNRIEFPKLESFVIDGEKFPLPLSAVDPPNDPPTSDELEYLVGFFDGDGCVAMDGRGRITLEVGQRLTSASVLLRFRTVFGGGIYAGGRFFGVREATLIWKLGGAKMKQAAELMACVPSMKQAQLRIAAACRKSMPIPWNEVARELRMLKNKDHIPPSMSCSWPYFAGFFDAEGSVHVPASHAGLRLEIGQVNDHVLHSLLRFLQKNRLTRWRIYQKSHASVLVCVHRGSCNQTLECLLAGGLSVKRRQAELALRLTPQNHREIRDAVSSLGGKQGRYNRLNIDGLARAKEIHNLQRQQRQTTVVQKRSALALEIRRLQEEHALQNLIHHCRLLRFDIRRRLSDGGKVMAILG